MKLGKIEKCKLKILLTYKLCQNSIKKKYSKTSLKQNSKIMTILLKP